jgi:chondroitin 4-sulfotransferase 11
MSIASLLQTYLHILRFESINETSSSVFLNPWRLSLKDVFPDIQFKSISNISNVFSPLFTRVLFVRHPFERLASAYKERIATLEKDRIQPEPHYDTVRKMICRRYALFKTAQPPSSRGHPCERFIPPFEHFIQFILTNIENSSQVARMDPHWQPYTAVCQVCQFKYNFIGKYETFNEDLTSLLKLLNVSDWNIQKRRGASGHITGDYQRLFSSLSDGLICRLKHLYRDDFNLFNYRLEDYVNRTTLICPS